jgi:hypothetical protein
MRQSDPAGLTATDDKEVITQTVTDIDVVCFDPEDKYVANIVALHVSLSLRGV